MEERRETKWPPRPILGELPQGTGAIVRPGLLDARLFTLEQRALLKGQHRRLLAPVPGLSYVAGIVLSSSGRCTTSPSPVSSSATVTVGQMVDGDDAAVRIVQHYRWHTPLTMDTLRFALGEHWGCCVVIIGEAGHGFRLYTDPTSRPATLSGRARRPPFAGSGGLLEAVAAGRVRMYVDDGSPEHESFWSQVVRARRRGTGPTLEAYVEPSTGDDGFLGSLLVMGEAADLFGSPRSPAPELWTLAAA